MGHTVQSERGRAREREREGGEREGGNWREEQVRQVYSGRTELISVG